MADLLFRKPQPVSRNLLFGEIFGNFPSFVGNSVVTFYPNALVSTQFSAIGETLTSFETQSRDMAIFSLGEFSPQISIRAQGFESATGSVFIGRSFDQKAAVFESVGTALAYGRGVVYGDMFSDSSALVEFSGETLSSASPSFIGQTYPYVAGGYEKQLLAKFSSKAVFNAASGMLVSSDFASNGAAAFTTRPSMSVAAVFSSVGHGELVASGLVAYPTINAQADASFFGQAAHVGVAQVESGCDVMFSGASISASSAGFEGSMSFSVNAIRGVSANSVFYGHARYAAESTNAFSASASFGGSATAAFRGFTDVASSNIEEIESAYVHSQVPRLVVTSSSYSVFVQ